jgi:hypothetical protein
MQIIVTGELLGEEYAGFRAISKHPAMEDIRTLVEKSEKEHDAAMKMAYKDLLDLLSKVDAGVVEEAKRRYPEMGKTLMQIMEPEIREERIKAAVDAIVWVNHCDKEDAIHSVAEKYGMTPDAVKEMLKKDDALAV